MVKRSSRLKMPPKPTQTWIRFKKSLCQTCWAACCHDMFVEVSVPDLIRLELISEREAAGDLETAAQRLQDKGILKPARPGSLIFILQQQKNLDCIYLNKKRRCTVYENRPEICRQFPKIGLNPAFALTHR